MIVFSITLEEHLEHLNRIFSLFERWNIILKASKTYLKYPTVALLRQKVNNFELVTAKEKLKAITSLTFLKTFKELKVYLDMTGYLRDYILYYAQKSNPLNQQKISLLKAGLDKGLAQKSFTIKTLLENPS